MKNYVKSNKIKKIISMLMAFVLLFMVIPVSVMTDDAKADENKEVYVYGDFEYQILDDGTVEIISYLGNDSVVELPGKINEKKVSAIGEGAFSFCYYLAEVSIPEGVESIGDYAFSECENLEKVIIPDSVESIGDYIFIHCYALEEFIVNEKNNYISLQDGVLFNKDKTELIAFAGDVEKYIFPNCALYIREGAFSSGRVEEIVLNDNITIIGDSAFEDCINLKVITMQDSVTYIGEWAFGSCINLTEVLLSANVMTIDRYAFYNCSSLTEIDIPENTREICGYAFLDCSSLIKINIPDRVSLISGGVFSNCSNLSEIYIPERISYIAAGAFGGCINLKSIIVDENNKYFTSIDNVLFDKNKTKLIAFAGDVEEYIVPDSTIDIIYEAFSSGRVRKVILNNRVSTIVNGAFTDCIDLTEITMPNSVTKIESYAFMNCENLIKITIPKSVDEIGENIFFDIPNVVIYCYKNSAAHQYAIENEIEFVLINDDNDYVLGDVNGDGKVTSIDARFALQAATGNYSLDETAMLAADANGDGKVTSIDARLILQAAAGNITL